MGVGGNARPEGVVLETYQPSGRFGAPALVRLAIAAVLAAASAWPYQRIVRWLSPDPFVRSGESLGLFAIPLTVALGSLLGVTARHVTDAGKSRSHGLNVVVVVVLWATAWLASFAWDRELLDASLLRDGARPLVFAEYVEAKATCGWAVAPRIDPRFRLDGALVYGVWALEGAILAFAAWRRARPGASRPFCERCNLWAEPTELRDAVGVIADELRRAAQVGNLAALVSPATNVVIPLSAAYVLHECPRCHDGGWLDVRAVAATARRAKSLRVTRPRVLTEIMLAPTKSVTPIRLATTPIVTGVVLTSQDRDAVVATRGNPSPLSPGPAPSQERCARTP